MLDVKANIFSYIVIHEFDFAFTSTYTQATLWNYFTETSGIFTDSVGLLVKLWKALRSQWTKLSACGPRVQDARQYRDK